MSLLYPEREEAMVSTYKYLQTIVDKVTFNDLLFMENNQGLRPLEQASNVAAFYMFIAMMETEGRDYFLWFHIFILDIWNDI